MVPMDLRVVKGRAVACGVAHAVARGRLPRMDDPVGRRLVGLQAALFVAIAAGPWLPAGRSVDAPPAAALLGALLVVTGAALVVAAGARLGRNLTPFPRPRADGELVTRGVYRYARHPIYGGVLLLALGWSLLQPSWVSGGATILLLWLFDRKSRYEERLLMEAYPGYRAYAGRTRRFVPFVY
jgi:protein-S-isoprenylcysteine O-methyltransferase Ste14